MTNTPSTMAYFQYILLLGIGATACMDLWGFFLKSVFDIQGLDYRLLGRWIGYFRQGVFFHPNIVQTPIIAREAIIGWATHYVIGITFSGVLITIWGTDWM